MQAIGIQVMQFHCGHRWLLQHLLFRLPPFALDLLPEGLQPLLLGPQLLQLQLLDAGLLGPPPPDSFQPKVEALH
jgi:hypothetical protein